MSLRSKKHFLGAVEQSLARAQVRPCCSILIALSGGPDSVALLHALRELGERSGYRLAAAHLNHTLRGDESDRDESFCRELCARYAINLIAERAAGLEPTMPNLEEAARHARHSFLDRAANQVGADYIATGHHADDQAETVLMRMLRGSGIAGLSAMAESVRPHHPPAACAEPKRHPRISQRHWRELRHRQQQSFNRDAA